jgi:pimeloyl-ACP methyl ester carboxylesterase
VSVSRPGYLGTPLAGFELPSAQADMLAALLDTLAIADAVVVAVSAGGPAALEFARLHPNRCRGLVLVSCCTGTLAIPSEVQARMSFIRFLYRHPLAAGLLGWMARRNPARSAARAIRDPSVLARTLADKEAAGLMQALQVGVFGRLRERLPGTLSDMKVFADMADVPVGGLTVPILVIHGMADRIVPFPHAARVADAVPSAELMAIEGGEHVCLFTHLVEVRARVSTFLERIAPVPSRA